MVLIVGVLLHASLVFAQDNALYTVALYLRQDMPCLGGFETSYSRRNRGHIGAISQQFESDIKPMSDLRRYVSCFSKSSNHADNFVTRFEEKVLTAAQFFRFPPQLMTCLAFREGQWETTAESSTGVRGAVQMTENTIDHVNELLRNGRVYGDIRGAWDQYFLRIRDVADRKVLNDPKQWPEYVPQQIDKHDPDTYKSLEIAFAINGAYLKFLQNELDKRLARYRGFNLSMLDYSLLLVAMYNGGAEGVLKKLDHYVEPKNKPARSELGADWEEGLSKLGLRGETVQHVKAIRRCMHRGVNLSLDGTTNKCSAKQL